MVEVTDADTLRCIPDFVDNRRPKPVRAIVVEDIELPPPAPPPDSSRSGNPSLLTSAIFTSTPWRQLDELADGRCRRGHLQNRSCRR